MNTVMKQIFFPLLAAAFVLSGCKNDEVKADRLPGQLNLSFDARVNDADFALNTDFRIGSATYRFDRLRYWVSNVALVDDEGQEYRVPGSYYLIEETSPVPVQDGAFVYPAKKREEVSIQQLPAGTYRKIKFSIGVDPKYNDNLSLQAGELSQLNGMTNISWMWHTSYIFTSVGGTLTEATAGKKISAETGLNTNYRSVEFDLPDPLSISSGNTGASVAFRLDVAKILEGLDLNATPTIGAGQAAAMSQLAGNYTRAISLVNGK